MMSWFQDLDYPVIKYIAQANEDWYAATMKASDAAINNSLL